MIVTCPICSSRFQYDESRFKGAPSKRFQCTACSAIFGVDNPFGPPPSEGSGHANLRPPVDVPVGSHAEADDETGYFGCAPFGTGFQKKREASLVFLAGPKSSSDIALTKSRTVIGRDEGDIMTLDPETSKRHAMIEIMNDGTVWVTDLGSTNGTLIDGLPIASTTQLHNRQQFTCGKSAFMIVIDED
jgi:hypothetical protein